MYHLLDKAHHLQREEPLSQKIYHAKILPTDEQNRSDTLSSSTSSSGDHSELSTSAGEHNDNGLSQETPSYNTQSVGPLQQLLRAEDVYQSTDALLEEHGKRATRRATPLLLRRQNSLSSPVSQTRDGNDGEQFKPLGETRAGLNWLHPNFKQLISPIQFSPLAGANPPASSNDPVTPPTEDEDEDDPSAHAPGPGPAPPGARHFSNGNPAPPPAARPPSSIDRAPQPPPSSSSSGSGAPPSPPVSTRPVIQQRPIRVQPLPIDDTPPTVTSVNAEQPTGIPNANGAPRFSGPFSIVNSSSVVVAVPTRLPQPVPPASGAVNNTSSVPNSNSYGSSQTNTTHPNSHHGERSTGEIPTLVAIILPIGLVLIGAALVAYRVIQRGRRFTVHRISGDSQLIIPGAGGFDHHPGPPHQMENVSEKHRIWKRSQSPYGFEDDLNNFGVRRESRLCPPLPSLNSLASPTVPVSSAIVVNNNPSFCSEPAITIADSCVSGGVPCRMNCVVARTFVPTMSDELAIDIGDRVVVYMLFDDGWCLGENLDFEKHEISEGHSRTGVLPQDCLTGLKRTTLSETSEGGSIVESSWRTAGSESGLVAPSTHQLQPLPSSQEILNVPDHSSRFPQLQQAQPRNQEPIYKPERGSSLLGDRETQLYLELDHALAYNNESSGRPSMGGN
ncbi:hypothetical protein PCASD_25410 [Puccinia coronata f. sp. avenae]|uniref:SH3 domain-containing protein n=1 Tax=Puccinia coronata f. sp. avenae TaxID=200324 RepID=A0A2N5RYL4_9BASI|nr:hypothetical protein PCASD_25410 [Puccinia coronata f. sp. avenae]